MCKIYVMSSAFHKKQVTPLTVLFFQFRSEADSGHPLSLGVAWEQRYLLGSRMEGIFGRKVIIEVALKVGQDDFSKWTD